MVGDERHSHIPQCFGCGPENPHALGIALEAGVPIGDGGGGSSAVGRVHFGPEHQGAPGLVHGGLLATLIDETMGAVVYGGKVTRVTAEMTVRYRRPTPVGTDLVCRARFGEATGRRFTVLATITAADAPDDVLVDADAVYVLLTRKERSD
jgi:acyl-coenzyme A thioesterase PaaI-like protein